MSADPLETAVVHVENEAWEKAAAALVEAWNRHKLPQLSDLVAAVDARIAVEPVTGATLAARERAWHALAADHAESILPRLLATPWPTHPRGAMARLDALAKRPASPRISHAVFALHTNRRYTSASGRRVSRRIFRLLFAHEDPIVTAYLTKLERHEDAADADTLADLLTLARRTRPDLPVPTRAQASALAKLDKLVAPKVAPASQDALFAEVYAAPFDDAPRAVLGDLLSERGDPRGELIQIQLRAPTAKSATRARALIRTAGAAWLHGLELDGASHVEWSRGFPVAARMKHGRFASPAWQTIEQVSLLDVAKLTDVATLTALRRLHGALSPAIALPRPAQLDELVLTSPAQLADKTELAPRLLGFDRVETGKLVGLAAKLPEIPVGRRVDELVVLASIAELPIAYGILAGAPRIRAIQIVGVTARLWPNPVCWSAHARRDHLALAFLGNRAHPYAHDVESVLDALAGMSPPEVTAIDVAAEPSLERVVPALFKKLAKLVASWPRKPVVNRLPAR